MSDSASGILAYGYNLGGTQGGWKIAESGEHGELAVAWFTEDSDANFITQAENRLIAATGAKSRDDLGVEFVPHCSGDYSRWVLAAKYIRVNQGHATDLDLSALAVEPAAHGWDDTLRAAVRALGITPTQQEPGWALYSYLG